MFSNLSISVLSILLFASSLTAQETAPDGAFLGVFKQGAGPVSSTVGGMAGYTFSATDALGGISGYGGGYWTKSGSAVMAGVLKRVAAVGSITAYCSVTGGIASEITTGLAGAAACFATVPVSKVPKIGGWLEKALPGADFFGGAAVMGANVAGYDFGGRRVIPGIGVRFPIKR